MLKYEFAATALKSIPNAKACLPFLKKEFSVTA